MVLVGLPPSREGIAQVLLLCQHRWINCKQSLDIPALAQLGYEIVIVFITVNKDSIDGQAMSRQEIGFCCYLSFGDPAVEMGTYILRFWHRSIIGVATDIEIVVVGCQFLV